MGCYICMGSVFSYSIPKEKLFEELDDNRIQGKSDSEITEELTKNFPLDIYTLSITDKWYNFSLRADVSVDDFIKLCDSFYSMIPPTPFSLADYEVNRANIVQMKTINEVWDYVNSSWYNLSTIRIPSYYYFKKYELFGKVLWVSTGVDGPNFYADDDKIVSEGSLDTFEIFTELLQYRFKDVKLGRTLLAYISA